ncbi:MAG TPA: lysophospholipid acyltransferase family protein [Rectinemataceae bacterium]|nr:lysophospholipid acyltransferase family protein [Rectinemataceae bacterium]
MSLGLSELLQRLFPDFVRLAPLRASRDLILTAGVLYFALNRCERVQIERNVHDLLGHGERSRRVKRAVFGHILEHYFEKLLVANRPLPFVTSYVRSRVETSGLSQLDAALALGRGVLAVTAHWGAVELIPPTLLGFGYPVSIVLEARTPRLRAALERLAGGSRAELIMASRGDRVLDRILDSLARGRVVVTQVDEVDAWRRRRSRTIELFGTRLFFDNTLDFIAKRSGAPAVGIFCKRRGGFRYSLCCEELVPDPEATDVSTAALKLWEKHTLDAPEQWYQWKKWGAMKVPATA